MKAINLSKVLKNHTSGWVSISDDNSKILASAGTLNELIKKIEKKGNPNGYIMKASRDYSNYVG